MKKSDTENSMDIKLLIIEDHEVVRQGLRMVLETDDEIRVVGEAGDGRNIEGLMESTDPNMILLDMELPFIHGVTLCKSIKTRWPKVKVLILTAYLNDNLVIEAIRGGADGYLLKDIEREKLITNIKETFQGKKALDSSMTKTLFENIQDPKKRLFKELTLSEEALLEEIAKGKTNKEIARTMDLAEKTVRNYSSKLFRKIGVDNRTEASNYYHQRVDK
ncbi:response regulator [Isachenkonia alkalipeptolytica]|nr:response regulator transcription factor [Isachenkonia alkalipeptolytica]